MIVFDDYGWSGYAAQQVAEDDVHAAARPPILKLPTGQGLLIKQIRMLRCAKMRRAPLRATFPCRARRAREMASRFKRVSIAVPAGADYLW